VRIQMLRFADDIAIVAQDEINLKRALESLDNILKSNYKMKINRKKVTVCFKDFENINIKMDDNALKQVSKFKCLGSVITEVGENEEDVINELKKLKSCLIIKSNYCVRITLVWK